ncbi:D-alanyl-D-alanine carboxypeptidase family protein [Clostridium luticellarii]|uniref:D-alanyl-D-alanine carboxypeptidase DacF n=1 Tax=Clostridium luticellarii TaxID=1691940 RepID=A0A2T0BLQ2_9CLOT|nr:D-alanyl-D-alanine carboxypeptidase family protein [Clostridium luticellarii]MCI1945479.1 D-alanyl-D-alanine carboxypeptidase [Clostridium luticellarii]MCI1968812.1 D-alanyl-D-alanine carboxypeptidase [Clostridium luticellarii]MCI1995851.1 D-alanyl-D-alanine carboxypeptidase [Clostridium luticellarii]MCI2040277.1 D-alanyl-D-alanine carboxypeptidase [Clostridium luticellarii]PRR84811.1 D-alanyl-D-alanine carboxypeptidase DacF precursor [Clostridium luticellarii]
MKNKINISLLSFIFILFLNYNVLAAEPAGNTAPDIYGKAAITVDMQTGEIIYEKNSDIRVYPASTTKLLTAILLDKNRKQNDTLTYTKGAKVQPESSINKDIHSISVGDTLSAKDVMNGLLMYSANDMAYVIAENLSKDSNSFAEKMNEYVKKLNLKNTHFVTPNGLHNPEHYSTAYDMSIIAREAFKSLWIRNTMGTYQATIKTASGLALPIKNTNKLLGKDGCIGGKTGYTIPAGRCLVAIYNRNGKQILGVVMNSIYDPEDTYVFNDMEKIINWSYSETPVILYKKDSIIGKQFIKYRPLHFIGPYINLEVPVKVKDNVTYYANDLNKKELRKDIKLSNINSKALKGQVPLGDLAVKERDSSKTYKIYSALPKQELLKKSIPVYLKTLLLILICGLAIKIIYKKISQSFR